MDTHRQERGREAGSGGQGLREAGLEALAREAAVRHGLPPELVAAICRVESGFEPWAARHEPGFRWLLAGAERPGACSQATEQQFQKTSFGLMQIMGAAARERGFSGWLTGLCDPAVGLEYGCRHLKWFASRFLAAHGWPGVVRAWNTGRAEETPAGIAYQRRIEAALSGAWPE